MALELTSTNASEIANALLSERRKAGSPTMGMVMTLLVVMDEGDHYDALRVARTVSREHPARILGVIRRSPKGDSDIDAELSVGASGESVLIRLKGEVTRHAESVVLPLLLADSPVVVWWPTKAPEDPAADPLGRLASRRITDSAAMERGRTHAILTQARTYADGNTDLAWTRLTPWRALLAAALDQYPAKIERGVVAAERMNPSADLLVAWLCDRLGVPVAREVSRGPGVTSVVLSTGGGPIEISRPDGLLAQFTIPNAANRPVALKRRSTPELLAEELRRLDPDDIYASTVRRLCKLADAASNGQSSGVKASSVRSRAATKTTEKPTAGAAEAAASAGAAPTSAKKLAKRQSPAATADKDSGSGENSTGRKPAAEQSTAQKSSSATKSTAKRSTAKKSTAKKSTTKKASR